MYFCRIKRLRMEMVLKDIVRKLGSDVIGVEGAVDRVGKVREILVDSRSAVGAEGSLFVAVEGKGNDGHKYIGDLYDRGMRAFVVTGRGMESAGINPGDFPDAVFIVVEDTVKALQRLARRGKRDSDDCSFDGELSAVTGSRGKTTLKEWLFQLLEPVVSVSRSPRSYNSQIGVPLSMWGLDREAEVGIVEAGISKKGEMMALAECINPDTVVVTNIGDAHSGGFASDVEKAGEKLQLLFESDADKLIMTADSDVLNEALELQKKRYPQKKFSILRWSAEGRDAELQIKVVDTPDGRKAFRYSFEGEESDLVLPGWFRVQGDEREGFHVGNGGYGDETGNPGTVVKALWGADFENAANALAFMLHRGIDKETIAGRFSELHKIATRLNVSEGVNGCTVIRDSYTSDFGSLRPALDFMRRRKTPGQSMTLVMADLHHEARAGRELYTGIAEAVAGSGVKRFIGIGPAMCRYSAEFESRGLEGGFFNKVADAIAELSSSDFEGETLLLKGSPEHDLSALAEMLEARRHETVLEVNLDAMVSNYNYFRRQLPQGVGMVCMVKAAGYGAGSYEVAKTLQDCGAAYLAVAVVDEGVELREKGITMPVIVMNPRSANYRAMFTNHLEPEVYSMDMLRDMLREARKRGVAGYPVHIKLDTGMHRMGFSTEELPLLMDELEGQKELSVRSVFSHLATADCPDMDDYTERQLEKFRCDSEYLAKRIESAGGGKVLRHVLNTAGILRYPEHAYDMVRLGIGLYGANTLPRDMEKPLATVSTLSTSIISIKDLAAGESVGYGRRGVVERASRIATIPIGYADGMNRRFGCGVVKVRVNGREVPTVGNICMDACMIDVTGVECKVGDRVEVFGPRMPVQRLADVLGTIPYEVLTSVSPRVKRVYYRE